MAEEDMLTLQQSRRIFCRQICPRLQKESPWRWIDEDDDSNDSEKQSFVSQATIAHFQCSITNSLTLSSFHNKNTLLFCLFLLFLASWLLLFSCSCMHLVKIASDSYCIICVAKFILKQKYLRCIFDETNNPSSKHLRKWHKNSAELSYVFRIYI